MLGFEVEGEKKQYLKQMRFGMEAEASGVGGQWRQRSHSRSRSLSRLRLYRNLKRGLQVNFELAFNILGLGG